MWFSSHFWEFKILNFQLQNPYKSKLKKQTFESIQTKCSMKNLHKNTFLSCGTSLVHLRLQWCFPLNTMNSINTSGTGRETNMEPPAHWPPAPPKRKNWITHRIQLGYTFDPHSLHSLFYFPYLWCQNFGEFWPQKLAKLVKIKLEKHIYPKIPRIFFEKKEKCTPKKKKKYKKNTGSPSVFFGEKPSLFGYSILPPQFVCTQQMFFQTKVIYL